MKYVIKSNDGYYMRLPGESLSSRYDDNGYSTEDIYNAILFDSIGEAIFSMFKDENRRFSTKNAKVICVEFIEIENISGR